jgi:voltage-gated potassium channel
MTDRSPAIMIGGGVGPAGETWPPESREETVGRRVGKSLNRGRSVHRDPPRSGLGVSGPTSPACITPPIDCGPQPNSGTKASRLPNLVPKSQALPRWIERCIKALIVYSVVTYLIEVDCLGPASNPQASSFFLWSERLVALLFTVEYAARWATARSKSRYPFSGMALVDLVAILPFWLELFLGSAALAAFRTVRIIRLVKYSRYNDTLIALARCLCQVRRQLFALGEVVVMVIVFGSVLMYEIERHTQPKTFGTIGNSMWWTFVTLTTVGYGDAYPVTNVGKIAAACIMTVGLGVVGTFLGIFVTACSDALHPKK